jgi:predicted phage tail protein
MTIVKLHGKLAEEVGAESWNLNISSVAEAFHAINVQSKDGMRKFFIKRENAYARYKVLVNGEETSPTDNIKENELVLNRPKMDTIDVVPVLEGAGMGWIGVVLGGLGMAFAQTDIGMMASLALLAMGISEMLAKPPQMPEQRQITNPSSDPTALANSYLFSGPANVLNEGGPVPLGYGRLIVGSQVIMSSYDIKKVLIREAGRVR